MIKQIKFVIFNITRICIGIFLSIFIMRDKNVLLFSSRILKYAFVSKSKELFSNNTKCLFLYLNNNKNLNLKTIWLCDDDIMLAEFQKRGFKNIYKRNSLKGLYYSLKAKYWFTDYSIETIASLFLSYNSICINFWHGIPLKKIGKDVVRQRQLNKISRFIKLILQKKEDYFILNNSYEQEIYKRAFELNDSQMQTLCSPRTDIFYTDIPSFDLFMTQDYEHIKFLHKNNKKLIIYMPTYRDTGKDISGWLKSDHLRNLLKQNNSVMICKLHPLDKNSLNFDLGDEFYKMTNDSDVYAILKYTNALITDYSSINFDYTLLDKPIIYYVPDLEEYQETCRGFYTPYEEFAVGDVCENEKELLKAINDVTSNIDNNKEKRKILRNKMFKYQDGKNCKRIIEFLRGL